MKNFILICILLGFSMRLVASDACAISTQEKVSSGIATAREYLAVAYDTTGMSVYIDSMLSLMKVVTAVVDGEYLLYTSSASNETVLCAVVSNADMNRLRHATDTLKYSCAGLFIDFVADTLVVFLNSYYVSSPVTTSVEVGMTVVHELVHAYQRRFGLTSTSAYERELAAWWFQSYVYLCNHPELSGQALYCETALGWRDSSSVRLGIYSASMVACFVCPEVFVKSLYPLGFDEQVTIPFVSRKPSRVKTFFDRIFRKKRYR